MQWLAENWIQNGIIAIILLAFGFIVHLIAIATFRFKLAIISMPAFFAGWLVGIITLIGLVIRLIDYAKA